MLEVDAFTLITTKNALGCTVFKIDIFARNSVDQNNPMIALKLAISGPFRGAKSSRSLHF